MTEAMRTNAAAGAGAAAQGAECASAGAGAVGAGRGGRFRITFDGARCVKCWACEVACRQWSGLEAAAPARRWVRETTYGVFPQVERKFVSEGCRHCADAPCVAACAFGALEQRVDGRVTVDARACVGCRRCASACPHDVPRFTAAGVMDKCDGCWSAGVPDGAAPHCVTTCPAGALGFMGAEPAVRFERPEPAATPKPPVLTTALDCTPRSAEGPQVEAGALAWPGGPAGSPGSAPGCAARDGLVPEPPAAPGEEEGAAEDSQVAAGAPAQLGSSQVAAGAPAQPAGSSLGSASAGAASSGALADSCDLLGALVLREVPAALLAALRDDPAAVPAPLASYAQGLQDADLSQAAEDLAVDFATVLCGMSPHPVFPYESTYADGDRLLMRPVRDDVVRAYAEAGFAVDPELSLPEDHLAFELAFVALLARREAAAREAGDVRAADDAAGRRAAFVRDHLGAWAPRFAADWARATASPFYRGIAQLLADVVEDAR